MNKLISILFTAEVLCCCIPASPNTTSRQWCGNVEAGRMEVPAVARGDVVISHTGYIAGFNCEWLIPNWVAYELTAKELEGTVRRPKNSPFQQDPACEVRQPERSDYSHSGWDKGHMAPCADMKWSEEAMFESFYFTNICPQDHLFNERDWQKLEDFGRDIARSKGAVFIVCGPIVTENKFGKLGPNGVVVPDAFFKAFLYRDYRGFHSIGFIMPNKYTGRRIEESAMSVNEIESVVGIDLFPELDDRIEEAVEGQLELNDWQ